MPSLRVATIVTRSLVLLFERRTGATVSIVRHDLEYVRDEGPLSGLQPSVGMDLVPALSRVGASRRLV
jgi:hypothetical protein